MLLVRVRYRDSRSSFPSEDPGNLNLVTSESSMNFGVHIPQIEEIPIEHEYTVLKIHVVTQHVLLLIYTNYTVIQLNVVWKMQRLIQCIYIVSSREGG